jgi:hypothetical protein
LKNAMLLAGAVLATLAAALPASAAHLPRTYWAETYAEQTLLDSAWAQDNALEDAQCVGRGRPHHESDGTADYLVFACRLYIEDNVQGGLDPFAALMRVIGNPDRYTLSHITPLASASPTAGQGTTPATLGTGATSSSGGSTGTSSPAAATTGAPIHGDWVGVLPGTSTSLYYVGVNEPCQYATAAGACFNGSYQPSGYTIQVVTP